MRRICMYTQVGLSKTVEAKRGPKGLKKVEEDRKGPTNTDWGKTRESEIDSRKTQRTGESIMSSP
jgi:hypothetical protein